MKYTSFTARVSVCLFLTVILPHALVALTLNDVWINEFHYDNSGGDSNEFVEIAAKASVNVAGISLDLYNGSDGDPYQSQDFSDADANNLVDGIRYLAFDISGIQNGPDGVAFALDGLVQFLSYEGAFSAASGIASGMLSLDVGFSEGGSTPVGSSLQLGGTGNGYADFSWSAPQAATRGARNSGQTFAVPNSSNADIPGVPDSGSTACYLFGGLVALLSAARRVPLKST